MTSMRPEAIDYSVIIEHIDAHFSAYVRHGRSDSRRVFHGRGQCFQGLQHITLDYFAPTYLLTLFAPSSEQAESELFGCVKGALQQHVSRLNDDPETTVPLLVQRRYIQKTPYEWVSGQESGQETPLFARRNALSFPLTTHAQNIGYFLDIEPARAWLEQHCAQQRVLNLFAYTCVFSVVAMQAGASSVVNMDMSSRSLAQGREYHRVNDISTTHVHFFANDILKSWSRLKRYGPYDVVIIDPPSYQKGSFIAQRDYRKVLRRMSSLCSEHAYIVACLNSPEITSGFFREFLEQALPEFNFVKQLAGNKDFPDADPERRLKMFIFQKVNAHEG